MEMNRSTGCYGWTVSLSILIGFTVFTGCGSSDSPTAGGGKSAAVASNSTEPQEIAATPEQVLQEFLDAARNGEPDRSRKMLTAKTVEQCNRYDLDVNPPGSPEMVFQIGRVVDASQVLGGMPDATPIDGGIFVESIWIEGVGVDRYVLEILWAMRKEKSQWRICGMVVQEEAEKGGVAEAPLFLDFENKPAEIAALMNDEAPQDSSSAAPGNAVLPAEVANQPNGVIRQ
jgi:proteasome lid subunit RPN8/RPN11